jgi:hypothetical protein
MSNGRESRQIGGSRSLCGLRSVAVARTGSAAGAASPGGYPAGEADVSRPALPGGARKAGGDDGPGVPVQAAAAPVIPHRGPRIRIGSRLLDIAERHPAIQGGGDERGPQRAGRDVLGDPGTAGGRADDPPRAVPARPPASRGQEHPGPAATSRAPGSPRSRAAAPDWQPIRGRRTAAAGERPGSSSWPAYLPDPAMVLSRRVTVARARPLASGSLAKPSRPARRTADRVTGRARRQLAHWRRARSAGIPGQAAVPGQEPGQGEPAGTGDGRPDRDQRGARGGSGHRAPPGPAETRAAGPAAGPSDKAGARRKLRPAVTPGHNPQQPQSRPVTRKCSRSPNRRGGLLCRPRGWVHADHPILQVQPGSGVTIMKASPGTRDQRPGDDDGVTPPSAPRHEDPSENPAQLTAHITRSAALKGPRFTRNHGVFVRTGNGTRASAPQPPQRSPLCRGQRPIEEMTFGARFPADKPRLGKAKIMRQLLPPTGSVRKELQNR